MKCYLCESDNARDLLSQPETPIWTNAPDDSAVKVQHPCVLKQCQNCGHIYQPMTATLQKALNQIYSSHQAQLSTSMGVGNWGKERGRSFLDTFFQMVDLSAHNTILEIGCDDGYLLRQLKQRGGKDFIGIEPSIAKSQELDGIHFYKEFANEDLKLPHLCDLIYAVGVFEHIEDMNSMLSFCKKNLSKEGKLFFLVPNVQKQLEDGDPALFVHQHIQYFTEDSARSLLARQGFVVKSIIKVRDELNVLATLSEEKISMEDMSSVPYQQRLEHVLEKTQELLQSPKTLVHGANNGLNNILSWLNKDFDFTLVDNDNTKHGKVYFKKKVHSLDDVVLNDFDNVLIVPSTFYEIIQKDYRQRGFKGRIESLQVGEECIKQS